MNPRLLTFVTVVEMQSFTRAAEQLHVTQSAVSKEIRALELEFGAKLLDRTNKLVRLTRAGEILYFHAENMVNEYSRAKSLIHDLTHTAAGDLSIGSSYTFGEYVLPHIIARFTQIYPHIHPKITIMNSNRIQYQVSRKEVDLGITEGVTQYTDIVTQPFATDQMVIIVPPAHRLSTLNEVDIQDLVAEPWILREPGSGTRYITDQLFRDIGFSPHSVMEFGSTQVIKESVRAGLGLAIVSRLVIQTDLKFNLLHALKIKGHPVTRDFVCVIHASQFRTKALDLFLEFLYQWKAPFE